MLSFGMLCVLAARMALRRRGLPLGSPPPLFAAMEISFDNLLKILPRLASIAPLKRLTFDHLLCPAIGAELSKTETCEQCSPRERNDLRGEKFTAPINRTKTYFVNRRSGGRLLCKNESPPVPVSMPLSPVDWKVFCEGCRGIECRERRRISESQVQSRHSY